MEVELGSAERSFFAGEAGAVFGTAMSMLGIASCAMASGVAAMAIAATKVPASRCSRARFSR